MKQKLQKNSNLEFLPEDSVIINKLRDSFIQILASIAAYYPLFTQIQTKKKQDEYLKQFDEHFASGLGNTVYSDIKDFYKNLIEGMHANKTCKTINKGLTKSIASFGRYQRSSIELADSDMIIYQSATGLFEKRVAVGELKKLKGL